MALAGKPIKATERMPAKADADRMGAVLVWDTYHKCWMRQHWQNLPSHMTASHWMTPPPPPES